MRIADYDLAEDMRSSFKSRMSTGSRSELWGSMGLYRLIFC